MGVYIKGIEMPTKCIECRLMRRCGKDDLDYVCMPARVYVEDLTNAYKPRPDYCPLIEVPPHGDLIDRNDIKDRVSWCTTVNHALIECDRAPTIIPAEKDK